MNHLNLKVFKYLDKPIDLTFEFLKFNVFGVFFFHFSSILLSIVYVNLQLQTAQTHFVAAYFRTYIQWRTKSLFRSDRAKITLENHWTRTAQSSWVDCSRRGQTQYTWLLKRVIVLLVLLHIVQKVQNLRAEHFESYSSFSSCTHSYVYQLPLVSTALSHVA